MPSLPPLLAPTDPALAEALEQAAVETGRILAGDLPDYVEERGPGFLLAGVDPLTAVHLIDTTPEAFAATAARWEGRFRRLGRAPMCWLTPSTRPADAARRLWRRGYRPGPRYRVCVRREPMPPPDLPTGLRVRRATSQHAHFIESMLRAAFADRPVAAWYFLRVLPHTLTHPDVDVFFVEVNGQPVLTCHYIRSGPFVQGEAWAALPESQARGLGSLLAQWGAHHFLSQGYDCMWMSGRAGGAGERVSLRVGYQPLYEREPWFRVPGPWPVRTVANATRPLRRLAARLRARRKTL